MSTSLCIIESGPTSLKTGQLVYTPVSRLQAAKVLRPEVKKQVNRPVCMGPHRRWTAYHLIRMVNSVSRMPIKATEKKLQTAVWGEASSFFF